MKRRAALHPSGFLQPVNLPSGEVGPDWTARRTQEPAMIHHHLEEKDKSLQAVSFQDLPRVKVRKK